MDTQTAEQVIVAAVGHDNPQGTRGADVVAALTRAGFVILAPQDIEWGECKGNAEEEPIVPGADHGPHRVSLSLCTYCLEYDPD